MKSKLSAALVATSVAMVCGIPRTMADNVYTFAPPQFTQGQTTPLLNKAPNSGDPAFNTSFTSGPATTMAFQISGQALGQFSFITVPNFLSLTFSIPVTQLSVDFFITGFTDPSPFLELVTSSDTVIQAGSSGTLTFSTATPFSAAMLFASSQPNVTTTFAIDNLHLTAVPAPIAGAGLPGLIFAGGGLLGWWRRRRKIP